MSATVMLSSEKHQHLWRFLWAWIWQYGTSTLVVKTPVLGWQEGKFIIWYINSTKTRGTEMGCSVFKVKNVLNSLLIFHMYVLLLRSFSQTVPLILLWFLEWMSVKIYLTCITHRISKIAFAYLTCKMGSFFSWTLHLDHFRLIKKGRPSHIQ